MDIKKQLELETKGGRLVLVVFYVGWTPHYEWVGPILQTYRKKVVDLIKVNTEESQEIADLYNIGTVPAFILLHEGHELWRQMGELTVDELKEVLDDFR